MQHKFTNGAQQDPIVKTTQTDKANSSWAPYNDPNYTGRSAYVYQELRDRKVALFISQLPQGVWQIHYVLRAEAPGNFHALPVLGQAMYVPEIRTNDDETTVRIEDKSSH